MRPGVTAAAEARSCCAIVAVFGVLDRHAAAIWVCIDQYWHMVYEVEGRVSNDCGGCGWGMFRGCGLKQDFSRLHCCAELSNEIEQGAAVRTQE